MKPPKVKPFYYHVTIHITLPETHLPPPRNEEKWIKRPAPGHRFSANDVNLIIHSAAHKITTTYPNWEFRMVRVRFDVVRFIYIGEAKPEVRP